MSLSDLLKRRIIEQFKSNSQQVRDQMDLEVKEEDPLMKQKEKLHSMIESAAPERVQEMLRKLGVCNA